MGMFFMHTDIHLESNAIYTTCMYMMKALHNWIWKAVFPGGSHSAHTQWQSRVVGPWQPLNVVQQKKALEVK